jgi:hypothetical protein
MIKIKLILSAENHYGKMDMDSDIHTDSPISKDSVKLTHEDTNKITYCTSLYDLLFDAEQSAIGIDDNQLYIISENKSCGGRSAKEIREALSQQQKNADELLKLANNTDSDEQKGLYLRQRKKCEDKILLLTWVLNE